MGDRDTNSGLGRLSERFLKITEELLAYISLVIQFPIYLTILVIMFISVFSLGVGFIELISIFNEFLNSLEVTEKLKLDLLKNIEWYLLAIFSYLLSLGLFKAFSIWETPLIPPFFKSGDEFEYSDLEKRLVGIVILFVGLGLIGVIISEGTAPKNILFTSISGVLVILGLSVYIRLVES